MPQFSVIMPCFNHALFVGESIEAVLAQSISDLEVIVVDDCSRDSSRQVIERYAKKDRRVRPIYHEVNLGASRSRNDGLMVARGEFVAFCDADDVWLPTKLARQLQLLEKYPGHDVAYCDAVIVDQRGKETGERFSDRFRVPGNGSGRLFEELCTRNFINIQTVVVRRNCIVATGCFDEGIKWVEDWWFWLRISHSRTFIYTEEVLAKYRVHPGSTGNVQQEGYKVNRVKVFHRILRNYPNIPLRLKAEIFYHIGAALNGLGKRKWARRYFMRSLEVQRANLRPFCRLLLSFIENPSPLSQPKMHRIEQTSEQRP